MNCVLYYYIFCGYSRAIRFFMSENAVQFSISYQAPWSITKECAAFCRMYNYPVLLDGGNRSFEGRSAILAYLEKRYGKNNLMPCDLQNKTQILQACDWVDDNISILCKQIVDERVHKVFVRKEQVDTIRLNKMIEKMHSVLPKMMDIIDINNGYIVGGSISMADVFAASFLSTIDYFGYIQWNGLYDLKTWYLKIKSRRNFYQLYDDVLPNLQPSRYYKLLDF